MVAPHLEKEQEGFLSVFLPRTTMWEHMVRGRFFLRGNCEVVLSRASPCSSGGRAVTQTHQHQELGIS